MKQHKNYAPFFLIILACISISSCDRANNGFDWSGEMTIIVPSELYEDAAIILAVSDFSDAVSELYNTKIKVMDSRDVNGIPDNSVLLVEANDTQRLSKISEVRVPQLADEGYLINSIHQDGKSLLLVSGKGVLGLSYGLFHLIEKIRINKATPIQDVNIKREPDMTFRMLTQPFEVSGYPEMASLEKPINQNLKREFDPMRPWEGIGYTPESEAKNILRAGLNAMWVGNVTYASLYEEYNPEIFPEGSKGREWVQERRKKIRELVDVAEKYHLKTVASTDVFTYPKSADPSKKWDLLASSLTQFLTDYPEIDRICSRFGENYSFFNPYYAGEGIKSEDQFAETIDFIHYIVSGQFGKTYMCRTWALGNDNWGADPENYLDVIKNVKADKDIIFSAKNTRTDYWRYNKFNPVIGIGDYPQAIEIACQDGYNFKNAIPYFEVARMANGPKELGGGQGLKKAYKEGVRTAWGWLSADGWCGPYIKREEWLKANIFGFSHLSWDVDKDPETIAREWAAIEFGVDISNEVVTNIADILLLSEDLILKTRYFRSYALQHEGWKPSNNWIRDNLIGGGEFSFNDPNCDNSPKPGHLKPIFNPATIEADIAEKLEAKKIVDEMLSKYEAIKDRIPDQEKAEEVHHTLLYAKYLIYSLVYYVNGMFRYYNGEFEKAITNLTEWKRNWTVYNEKIPNLNGSASLMLDGGMVQTVEEAMTDMGRSFQKKPPLNILLITADDLGLQLGCYGDSIAPTSHLDTYARKTRNVADVATQAKTFIDTVSRPFFLMVNYFDQHVELFPQIKGNPKTPYMAWDVAAFPFQKIDTPKELKRITGYYSCVERLDTGYGMLVDAMEKTGKADNTLVIFLGDHGSPFVWAKKNCYKAGLKVPFWVKWPHKAATKFSGFVNTNDIVPKVFDAAQTSVSGYLPVINQQRKALIKWQEKPDDPLIERERFIRLEAVHQGIIEERQEPRFTGLKARFCGRNINNTI